MGMTERQMARLHDIIRAFEGISGNSCVPWAREFAAVNPGVAETAANVVRQMILADDDIKAVSSLIGMFNRRGTIAAIKLLTQ
jgi:hypothetical protein